MGATHPALTPRFLESSSKWRTPVWQNQVRRISGAELR